MKTLLWTCFLCFLLVGCHSTVSRGRIGEIKLEVDRLEDELHSFQMDFALVVGSQEEILRGLKSESSLLSMPDSMFVVEWEIVLRNQENYLQKGLEISRSNSKWVSEARGWLFQGREMGLSLGNFEKEWLQKERELNLYKDDMTANRKVGTGISLSLKVLQLKMKNFIEP